MTARRVLFGLLLLTPLADLPGSYDILRLPLALALGAALLASGPFAAPGRAGAALLALLGVQALSLLVSPDPAAGVAAVLVTAAGFAAYAAARDVPSSKDLMPLLTVLAGILLGVAAWQRRHGEPGASLLGNSNYAGALAAMLLPGLAAGPRKSLAWFGAAGAAALLALSESRGALVGAGAGMAVSASLLWRSGRRREAAVFAAVLLVAASVGVAANPAKFLSSETMTVRTGIWKGAARMAVDRPLLGVGAGGFGASFPPYRDAVEARISQRDVGRGFAEATDPHSSWIRSFAEGGVPGALAWLVLVGVLLRLAWRAGPEGAGWAGAAAAFVAAGLFNTLSAHVSHAVLFGAALGLLEGPSAGKMPKPAAWAAVAVLAIGALWGAGRIAPDLAYHRATSSADPAERLALLEKRPDWRSRYQAAVELDRCGRSKEAVAAYRDVLARRPYHGACLNNLAMALLKGGEPEEAERTLARALEVAPHYYMIYFNLGVRRLKENRLKEARDLFTRAAWLNDRHPASRYEIAVIHLAEGDIPGALPHLRRVRELGVDVAKVLAADFPALAADPRFAELKK